MHFLFSLRVHSRLQRIVRFYCVKTKNMKFRDPVRVNKMHHVVRQPQSFFFCWTPRHAEPHFLLPCLLFQCFTQIKCNQSCPLNRIANNANNLIGPRVTRAQGVKCQINEYFLFFVFGCRLQSRINRMMN